MMHLTHSIARYGLQALLSALLLAIPLASGAQVVEPGARVRVTVVGGSRITGAFEAMGADSVRLATPGGPVAVPLSSLEALDISTGRHRRFPQTMVVTIGAFATLGGVMWASTYKPCDDCIISPDSRGEAFRWGAISWGLVGVPAGIIAGSMIRHERWAPIYRPGVKPLRVSVRPVLGRRVGFAAAVVLDQATDQASCVRETVARTIACSRLPPAIRRDR